MKAVVWHGVGDIRVDEVPDPKILEPSEDPVAVVKELTGGIGVDRAPGNAPGLAARWAVDCVAKAGTIG